MFDIRRRSTGEIIEGGYAKREDGKKLRNALNEQHHGISKMPEYNREYYIVRSKNHYRGASK